MQYELRSKLNQPGALEQLYQSNPGAFKQAFNAIYPDIQDLPAAQFWHERLSFDPGTGTGSSTIEVISTETGSDSAGSAASIVDNTSAVSEDRNLTSDAQGNAQGVAHKHPQVASESAAGEFHRESEPLSWGTPQDWLFIAVAALVAGFLANIPNLFDVDPNEFYPRNISFLVLPWIAAYLAWKRTLHVRTGIILAGIAGAAALYMNLLPDVNSNDGSTLAAIHLPLLLWAMFGYVYVHERPRDASGRLNFLGFNAEILVMSGLLLISGAIFSGITVGLFEMIGIQLSEILGEYFILWVLPWVPLAATWLVMANPRLVSMVSPVIARVFTPLALAMLLFYLAAMLMAARDPYQDREFLLVFNMVLLGVMALILFSVPDLVRRQADNIRFGVIVLFLLSVVTLVVNGVALSAIIFRIFEWGITPNRLAVTGANILMLVHLLLVTASLWRSVGDRSLIGVVQDRMASFLPVYVVWVLIVVVFFPLM